MPPWLNLRITSRPTASRSCAASRSWASIPGGAASMTSNPLKPSGRCRWIRPTRRASGPQAASCCAASPASCTSWRSATGPVNGSPRQLKGKEHAGQEIDAWSSYIQVMIGQKQVGEQGWALAQELDLGDLIGVDGTLGKTRTGELTIFADRLTSWASRCCRTPTSGAACRRSSSGCGTATSTCSTTRRRWSGPCKRIKIVRTIRSYLDERGFVRGRDADAARHRRRRRGPAVHHAPQRPGHRPVPAHRPGTAPEAAAGRRHREGLRDRPGVPQRGHQPPAQPRIHHDGAVPGLRRLPHHDGPDRGPDRRLRRGPGRRPAAALRRAHHRLHAALAARAPTPSCSSSTSACRWTTPTACARVAEQTRLPDRRQAPRRDRPSPVRGDGRGQADRARSSSTTTRRRCAR